MRKKHFNEQRGPGTYPIYKKDTAFNIPPKQEQF